MQIKTTDKIVQQVLRKMDERSLVGQKKYGSTMQDEIDTGKKDLHAFLPMFKKRSWMLCYTYKLLNTAYNKK